MKNILFLLSFSISLYLQNEVFACESDTNKVASTTKVTLLLKQPFNIMYGAFIEGSYTVDGNGFRFEPKRELGKQVLAISYGHLFQDIQVEWKDVAKIKRRSTLLIFPDRLYIKMKDKKRYFFLTYKRKSVINAYKAYLQAQR